MEEKYWQKLGLGVASLTFGVALSVFIFEFYYGKVYSSIQTLLLYGTSFLLMLRFWWRYTELFVQFLPSRSYLHFLFDFAISFFGIAAVLFVGNIQTWAILGAAAMIASVIRCSLSWKSTKKVKTDLRWTLIGSIFMFIVFSTIYVFSPIVNNLWLAGAVFVVVLIFVIFASFGKK